MPNWRLFAPAGWHIGRWDSPIRGQDAVQHPRCESPRIRRGAAPALNQVIPSWAKGDPPELRHDEDTCCALRTGPGSHDRSRLLVGPVGHHSDRRRVAHVGPHRGGPRRDAAHECDGLGPSRHRHLGRCRITGAADAGRSAGGRGATRQRTGHRGGRHWRRRLSRRLRPGRVRCGLHRSDRHPGRPEGLRGAGGKRRALSVGHHGREAACAVGPTGRIDRTRGSRPVVFSMENRYIGRRRTYNEMSPKATRGRPSSGPFIVNGAELRYLHNCELRASQAFRDNARLQAGAAAKRNELLAKGWTDNGSLACVTL